MLLSLTVCRGFGKQGFQCKGMLVCYKLQSYRIFMSTYLTFLSVCLIETALKFDMGLLADVMKFI